jgi:menaquinone-dependent protoporphyrinogen IX oxidase
MEMMHISNKILVAYASKGGATKEASEITAEVLKKKYNSTVDLIDLRKSKPKLVEYDRVVVGAGVRGGKVYNDAVEFLKQNFESRKVSFFVCCGGAGDPQKYQEACKTYVTDILAKYPDLKPTSTEAFGGRMKILGKKVFDNFDSKKIQNWAEKIDF